MQPFFSPETIVPKNVKLIKLTILRHFAPIYQYTYQYTHSSATNEQVHHFPIFFPKISFLRLSRFPWEFLVFQISPQQRRQYAHPLYVAYWNYGCIQTSFYWVVRTSLRTLFAFDWPSRVFSWAYSLVLARLAPGHIRWHIRLSPYVRTSSGDILARLALGHIRWHILLPLYVRVAGIFMGIFTCPSTYD